MTWIGELELSSIATLGEAPSQLDLLIIDSDGLTAGDVERVASHRRSTPVVSVGAVHLAVDRSFGPKLTSRELKQAIRELVFARMTRAASPA